LPSKVEPPKVKLEGWGNNALKVTLTNLQRKERERINMNLSAQRHGTLYRFEEILHTYQEVRGGMETRSKDRGYA
jgi:hypothetical protein